MKVEFLVAMVWMIFGAGFYSFTLGSLSTLLANLDTRKTHLLNKMMLMEEFCKENKFPKVLKSKVKQALEYSSVKNIFSFDEKNQLLSEIPTELRFQIAEFMFSGLSTRIPFFKHKDKCFIANFVPLLNPLKVLQGELIFRKNEYPNLVYFLYAGRVNYVVGPQNIVFKSMVEGSYFGEIEIYENRSRYFNCRAETNCDLLTISSDRFIRLMKSFPDHEVELKQVIFERKKRNEIALEKIKSIAPISVNSEFWKKKKEVNLYEAVKMKRLHVGKTMNLDQNIPEGGSTSKFSKFRRFFTNIFSRNRTSLKSQESDNNIPPVQNSLAVSKISQKELNEEPLQSPPAITIRKLSKREMTINTNSSPAHKKIELFKRKPTLKKEEDKISLERMELAPMNSTKPLMDEQGIFENTDNRQGEIMTASKKKRVTISPMPLLNDHSMSSPKKGLDELKTLGVPTINSNSLRSSLKNPIAENERLSSEDLFPSPRKKDRKGTDELKGGKNNSVTIFEDENYRESMGRTRKISNEEKLERKSSREPTKQISPKEKEAIFKKQESESPNSKEKPKDKVSKWKKLSGEKEERKAIGDPTEKEIDQETTGNNKNRRKMSNEQATGGKQGIKSPIKLTDQDEKKSPTSSQQSKKTNDRKSPTEIKMDSSYGSPRRGRSKTEIVTPTLKQADSIALEYALSKINELKDDDELPTRHRSRTEAIPKAKQVRNSMKRKFSAFKNMEINNILASFQSPQLRPITWKKKEKKSKENGIKKKLEGLEKSISFFKESLKKQTIHHEFNENSVYIIQDQLGKVNDYLKLACKRNRALKKDPNFQGYFMKPKSFKVGQRIFAGPRVNRPKQHSSDEDEEIKYLTDRWEMQEIGNFPEPEELLQNKNEGE